MKAHKFLKTVFGFLIMSALVTTTYAASETAKTCFESRQDYSTVLQKDISKGWPNVKCSPTTDGVLWWGDPFDGTIPMGDMPVEADYSHEEAVVKPRVPQLDKNKLFTVCTMACHNGKYVPIPSVKTPRSLQMHTDIVPNALNLQHGRGAIWCLDCHSTTNRSKLVDHFGSEISFNQPQKLCGKCHGQVYRDWRDGIHGKRTGMWVKGGKKRWWVCTECHNPHDVQQGVRNSGFAQLSPENAPVLPKGMKDARHERHVHGDTPWWNDVPILSTLFGHTSNHSSAHWDYKKGSPDYWGTLSPDYKLCSAGKQQSPINIGKTAVAKTDKPLIFKYTDSSAQILNNGHTIQVTPDQGGSINIDGENFKLLQFHFHTPSEHTINGKPAAMVAHLVHQNAAGQLGVVGVLMQIGKSNPMIQKIWDVMPMNAVAAQKLAFNINVKDLLPAVTDYYAYSGSLTTPPCSEGVNWRVLSTPITISKAQLDKYHWIHPNSVRPVQPLNGREVISNSGQK